MYVQALQLLCNLLTDPGFRCSTCNSQLDCNTNLLVLGNGSLICSDCSYHCHVCHKKIEDLAILTGDYAFCSSCFCCRNCKKKIEDLQYARTSQGIFCMSCHETLLARKKKTNASASSKQQNQSNSPPVSRSISYDGNQPLLKRASSSFKDKSLPSLPPGDLDPSDSTATSTSIPRGSSPPNRPTRQPPFDPSLTRNPIQRSQNSSSNASNLPRTISSTLDREAASWEGAPLVSISQSSPVLTQNGQNGNSTTLTETRRKNSNPTRIPDISGSLSGLGSSDQQPLDSHSSDAEKLLRIDGLSLSLDASNHLSQSAARAGLYLDTSSTSSISDERPSATLEDSLEKLIPERSRLRSVSPSRAKINDTYSDSIQEPGFPSLSTSSVNEGPIKRKPLGSRLGATLCPPIQSEPEYNPYFPNGVPKSSRPTLTHKRSVSEKISQQNHNFDQYSLESVMNTPSLTTTTRELLSAKKRIAHLEQQLREKEEVSKPDAGMLDLNIQEKRKTIAGLEAQGEVAKKELLMLEDARMRDKSIKESSSDLVAEFTQEVSLLKQSLQAEIENLVMKRDRLSEENDHLAKDRDRVLEEIGILNLKNNQLLDLHHELSRQLIDKNNPRSLFNVHAKTRSSENLASVFSGTETTSTAVSSLTDEPMVTLLDGSDDKKERNRRFWKRPTAAVAKGVKGFNKVFAPETTFISSGPYADSEQATTVEQVSQFSGGSSSGHAPATVVSVLSKDGAARGHKNQRNGWFKGSIDSKGESQLMGYPIEKRIQVENTTIPLIVTRCIQEVEARGMLMEGIYRKSGARSQISAIEEAFEKSFDAADFEDALTGDISGVTSALKQYLRYLPNSLIHIDHYDNFVEAARIPEQAKAIEQLRYVINSLPPAYRDCLNLLMHHLSKVCQYSEVNLMTSRNLAVCFAPTLVRHTDGTRELLDMQPRNDGTQLMIEHYSAIFADFL